MGVFFATEARLSLDKSGSRTICFWCFWFAVGTRFLVFVSDFRAGIVAQLPSAWCILSSVLHSCSAEFEGFAVAEMHNGCILVIFLKQASSVF